LGKAVPDPVPPAAAVDPLEFAAQRVTPANKIKNWFLKVDDIARSKGDTSGPKGALFAGVLGFDADTLPPALWQHLRSYIRGLNPTSIRAAGGGVWTFSVEGPMTGPNGVTRLIRTVWSVSPDGIVAPVTGYAP
jgi:hypothetical protein